MTLSDVANVLQIIPATGVVNENVNEVRNSNEIN